MGVFDAEQSQSLSTSALVQFAGADVTPYTNVIASIMFKDFQLSVKGQRNVAACLSNLPYVETLDERLAFGWGPDNVMRQQVVHRYGYEHLTVVVALASTFHEAYAAEVCFAYAASMAGEDETLPHMGQWKRQMRIGCGAFAASGFAQLVEEYIRLDPYCVGPGSNLRSVRCRVDAKAMAQGLMALSRVTSKKQKQVTIVGGAVIGWYAALAEYFYDLQVVILSRTGEKVHGDPLSDANQVILIYHEDPDIEVLEDFRSIIQNDRSGSDNDDPFWTRHVHFLPFGGRVQWHALLPQVFGHAYWILEHEEARSLADLIGGCARGLEGDYVNHRDNGSEAFFDAPANPSSYGVGLIENLTGWLPELRKGQGRMERQLKRDYQDAAFHYDTMIRRFQKLCHCTICTPNDDAAKAPKDGYCIPTICETIIALGLAVSRLTVTSGIYPTREGVQGLYSSQAQKRLEVRDLDPKNAADRVKFYSTIYGCEWKAGNSRRLQNAIELFSGSRPESDLPTSLVAVAHEGICAYVVSFRRSDRKSNGVSHGANNHSHRPHSDDQHQHQHQHHNGQVNGHSDNDIDSGLIEITSGAINVRRKIFTRVSSDPVLDVQSREALPWEEIKFKHHAQPLYCK